MNDPLDQFKDEAEEIADRLLRDAKRDNANESHLGESSGEAWGFDDIGDNLRRMVEQSRDYEQVGAMFPVARVGGDDKSADVVPVDVPALIARFRPMAFSPYHWSSGWPFMAHHMAAGFLPNGRIEMIPPAFVGEVVRGPLRRFLANRLLGRSMMTATTTAPFRLHCNRNGSVCHGRTAFYTPAYFITLGPYGSVPTSPVSGALAPGYYHFGADHRGGGSAIIDYHKRFDIPVNSSGTIDV